MSDNRPDSSYCLDRSTAALMLWGLMAAVATLSVGLALAGRVPVETPAVVPLLLTAALTSLHAAALRLVGSEPQQTALSQRLVQGLAGLIAPTLAGFAWSPSGSITAIAGILVLMLVATGGVIVWNTMESTQRDESACEQPPVSNAPVSDFPPMTAAGLPSSESPDIDTATEESSVSLWLVRREIDGQDVMDVTARLEFPPGVKQVAWHLPISPAMSAAPDVECEPLDEADVELSVGAVYPYGLRIDARRSDVESALTTTIGLQATAPQTAGRAAA